MIKQTQQIISVLILSLILIILNLSFAFAGNGDGSGGNSDLALTIESYYIKNDDKNVSLNPTIDLKFNKNVVNISVIENNSKCFHLVDDNGNTVTIKVIFPDDQVKSTYREHIFIQPKENLKPNTNYTLYVDSTLKAKNTTSLDSAKIISFTTGTSTTNETNASLTELKDDIKVFTNQLPITINSKSKETTSKVTEKNENNKFDNNKFSKIIIIVVLAALLIFTILMYLIKHKEKNNNSNQS